MEQLALFPQLDKDVASPSQSNVIGGIVNVATVPQHSPFRYPGGKTWLAPRMRQWLRWLGRQDKRPTEFIEPFAGGGSMSLLVAFERLAGHVTMIELDPEVAAVWHTVLEGDGTLLAQDILCFTPTPAAIAKTLTMPPTTLEARAFQTIVRNRVQRGGILAPGAGLIKQGEAGRGVASRWYPETLKRRILDIIAIRERITFIEGDGLRIAKQYVHRDDVAFFFDPPYTAAGKKAGSRLYSCSELDHEALFALAGELHGDFLMTYDNAEGVHELARKHHFEVRAIAMKNTHHAKMSELLIGRDLRWLDE